MKKNLIVVVALLLLAGCNKNEDVSENEKTISLSDTVLHFTSKAYEVKKVTVSNLNGRNVFVDVDWISIEKQADTVIINASPHRSLTNRETSISIVDAADPQNKASIRISQEHGTAKYYRMDFGGIPIEHFSYNGRWAIGEWENYGIVLDLHHITDPSYLGILYRTVERPDLSVDGILSLRGVSNYGEPFAKGVTADGRITVYTEGEMPEHIPYVKINGVGYPLSYPEIWRTGGDYYGVIPDLISSDGKYILGRIENYGGVWVACKWTLIGGNYVFAEIAPEEIIEQVNGPYIEFDKYPRPQYINGLSPDGKYSCGVLRSRSGLFAPEINIPYIYNMETGDLVKLEDERDAIASCVTDDGTLFYATPNRFPIMSDRIPYVYENGQKQTFKEWVQSKYNIDIGENKGIVKVVSKDRNVIVWMKGDYSNHFIIAEP